LARLLCRSSLDEWKNWGGDEFYDFGRWTPSWLGLATNLRMKNILARLLRCRLSRSFNSVAIATTESRRSLVYYSHGRCGGSRFMRLPRVLCPSNTTGERLVDGFLTARRARGSALILAADIVIAVYLERVNVEEPRTFTDISAARSIFSSPYGSDMAHAGGRDH